MTPTLVIPVFGKEYETEWLRPNTRNGATWHRLNAYTLLRDHLAGLGWPILVESGATQGQARNRGARRALDKDVVVFNDADTFVPLEQIRVAASLAADASGLVFAFTEYDRLSEAGTASVNTAEDVFTIRPSEEYVEPPSHGCVAISRRSFFAAGGYDERLEAFEDCALTHACGQRWPSRRVDGRAVHLWHPRLGEVGDPAWEERFASSREIWEREYLGAERV